MVSRNAVNTEPKGMRTHRNSKPTTFKVLQRETSVWKYHVELEEDVFTEQGYFDLTKVSGLRVSGAGQFLKNLRFENGLGRKDITKIIGVSRGCLKQWENNLRGMPLQSLVKIAEALGVSRDTIYSMIDQGKFHTKNKLPVKFEKIRDIVKYLFPYKTDPKWQISVFKSSKETISKIEATLNVNVISASNRHPVINSRELHNFLTTFFKYTEVPKIHPPLTNEVRRWYESDVGLIRAVIIPCLQSDGYIQQSNQGYSEVGLVGNNRVLHHYFVDAIYYEYGTLPSSYFIYCSSGDCYNTYYKKKSIRKITDAVMNLAGNAKTAPAHRQTIDEYLKEPQPHLHYLMNASETEQQIALRIWAATEGSITISRHQGYVYPCLAITCAHPDLAKQLQQIAWRFNINFRITRLKRNWSGTGCLSTTALSSCIEFLKLGGFIKGVKIGAHSKYHEGIDKDVLLRGILEYKTRELENSRHKKLSIQQVHHKINKIVENRDYKLADYYINYFS